MATKSDKALDTFSDGFNCAQAVFAAFAPEVGTEESEALRIAAGFGGGMARLQEVCGAVTGAFMAIGSKYGSADPNDGTAKTKAYKNVRIFADRFREQHGTIFCRDILGIDLNTEEGQRIAGEKNLFGTVCARCVEDSAKILEYLLAEESAMER